MVSVVDKEDKEMLAQNINLASRSGSRGGWKKKKKGKRSKKETSIQILC